jgi:hypothetical protein
LHKRDKKAAHQDSHARQGISRNETRIVQPEAENILGIALVPRQIFLVKCGVDAKMGLRREGIPYEKLSDCFMRDGLGD